MAVISKSKQKEIIERLKVQNTLDISRICLAEDINVSVLDFNETRDKDTEFRKNLLEIEQILKYSTLEELRVGGGSVGKRQIVQLLNEGILSGVDHKEASAKEGALSENEQNILEFLNQKKENLE